MSLDESDIESVAIIGLACRFPEAENASEYWQNILAGKASIKQFTYSELKENGCSEADLSDEYLVKANGVLEGIELFDNNFFEITARDAKLMDPQLRLALQCAWSAFENAGINVNQVSEYTGVFASASLSSYLLNNLLSNRENLQNQALEQLLIYNEKDFIASMISYKLGLKGPSISINAACSSSLVAVHCARQSLINYETDVCLAGGVSIHLPQGQGYRYQQGGIYSKSGYCRAFDVNADGTVGGSGVGFVVLKRLQNAIQEKDNIVAIIRGSAVNNDGTNKQSFMAPSVEGQRNVIEQAMSVAGVSPQQIRYIETHGTGTSLGDVVEIEALRKAFSSSKPAGQTCWLGAVKSNIGHLNAAAGIAGLIKTALLTQARTVPPQINFNEFNPMLAIDSCLFKINMKPVAFRDNDNILAGVSSFGVGGTNVHLILQQAPAKQQLVSGNVSSSNTLYLLPFSARSLNALSESMANLKEYLIIHKDIPLDNIAYTLATGRVNFNYREFIVAKGRESLLDSIDSCLKSQQAGNMCSSSSGKVIFMFPGHGSQYKGMFSQLYKQSILFKRHMDHCIHIVKTNHNLDMQAILFGAEQNSFMDSPLEASLALFMIEYSIAKALYELNVKPSAMIGFSQGEYSAACIAGVITLEECLWLLYLRGKGLQKVPAGQMLLVGLSEADCKQYLSSGLSIAAVNAPEITIISGPIVEVEQLRYQLLKSNTLNLLLPVVSPFHSTSIQAHLSEFINYLNKVKFKPPQVPYISCLTGDWITTSEVIDKKYWVKQTTCTVRFSDGIKRLRNMEDHLFLELGPGQSLSNLLRKNVLEPKLVQSVDTGSRQNNGLTEKLHNWKSLIGNLWKYNVSIDWQAFYRGWNLRKEPLPGYSFQQEYFWIDSKKTKYKEDTNSNISESVDEKTLIPVKTKDSKKSNKPLHTLSEIEQLPIQAAENWYYKPVWIENEQTIIDNPDISTGTSILILSTQNDLSRLLVNKYKEKHCRVIELIEGEHKDILSDNLIAINCANEADYVWLFETLDERNIVPDKIVHLWNMGCKDQNDVNHIIETESGSKTEQRLNDLKRKKDICLYSLVYLAKAIATCRINLTVQLSFFSENLFQVHSKDHIIAENSLSLGIMKVLPLEMKNIQCQAIDLPLVNQKNSIADQLRYIIYAINCAKEEPLIAFRDGNLFKPSYKKVSLSKQQPLNRLKENGVYLISGGLGGVGLSIAKQIAQNCRCTLVLVSRTPMIAESDWVSWLSSHSQRNEISKIILSLLSIKDLGAEIIIETADVADYNQMANLNAALRKANKIVNGIIHCAGLPDTYGVIQNRNLESIEEVLRPKVEGTIILHGIFTQDDIDFCVFSSALGATLYKAKFGESAYVIANDFIDAMSHEYQSNLTNVISICWSDWLEVGMSAKAANRSNQTGGIKYLYENLHHPLLDFKSTISSNTIKYGGYISPRHTHLLKGHLIDAVHVLPGTGFIEMLLFSIQTNHPGYPVSLSDLVINESLHVDNDETVELNVVLDNLSNARNCRVENNEGRIFANGKYDLGNNSGDILLTLDDVLSNTKEYSLSEFRESDINNQPITLGAEWKCVEYIRLGSQCAMAKLRLTDSQYLSDHYLVHPVLLDSALGFLCHYFLADEKGLFVPFRYKNITLHKPLTEEIYSYGILKSESKKQRSIYFFSIVIFDIDGNLLLEIDELSIISVENGLNSYQKQSEIINSVNYHLDIIRPGDFSSFYLSAVEESPLNENEIKIEVDYYGLNFKEVMTAYGGLVKENGDKEGRFGVECVGRVIATGIAVNSISIGDEVLTFGGAWTVPYVIVSESLVYKTPGELSSKEAVSMPSAFITAHHCLFKLGNLSCDSKVLIHSAASGVGLAAIKILQTVGAEIYATVSTDEKRNYLASIGVENVYDSTDSDYVNPVKASSGGIDIILNGLSGKLMEDSFGVLVNGGRFIDLGVTGILNNTPLGMQVFKGGMAYFSVFLDFNQHLFRESVKETISKISEGIYTPLPYTCISFVQLPVACASMLNRTHIGKIILAVGDNREHIEPEKYFKNESDLRPNESLILDSVIKGMTISEGGNVFMDALGMTSYPQVIISKQDLNILINIHKTSEFSDLFKPVENPKKCSKNKVNRQSISSNYATGQTDSEIGVITIWEELIGLDGIGINDNFFELGGDSLLALRVISQLKEVFNIEQTLSDLYDCPTVSLLAERIDTIKWLDKDNSTVSDSLLI